MITGVVAFGKGLAGAIENGAAPGILKTITSVSPSLLASRMAWRNEPAPLSFVVVTLKVAASSELRPVKSHSVSAIVHRSLMREWIRVAIIDDSSSRRAELHLSCTL